MIQFERLYDGWRKLKTSRETAPAELDQRAGELIDFLLARNSHQGAG